MTTLTIPDTRDGAAAAAARGGGDDGGNRTTSSSSSSRAAANAHVESCTGRCMDRPMAANADTSSKSSSSSRGVFSPNDIVMLEQRVGPQAADQEQDLVDCIAEALPAGWQVIAVHTGESMPAPSGGGEVRSATSTGMETQALVTGCATRLAAAGATAAAIGVEAAAAAVGVEAAAATGTIATAAGRQAAAAAPGKPAPGAAAGGLYLDPPVLSLSTSGMATPLAATRAATGAADPTSSSSGRGGCGFVCGEAAQVMRLHLSTAAVLSLLEAGCSYVRVVIGPHQLQQKERLEVPLDYKWSLPSKAGPLDITMEVPPSVTTTVTSSISSTNNNNNSSSSSRNSVQGHTQVPDIMRCLSLVLLAGGGEGGQLELVLADLPLLLLPEAASKELQEFVLRLLNQGTGHCQAFAEVLLPLLRDWSILIKSCCYRSLPAAAAASGIGNGGLDFSTRFTCTLPPRVVDRLGRSLEEYCGQVGMAACEQLVLALMEQEERQAVQQALREDAVQAVQTAGARLDRQGGQEAVVGRAIPIGRIRQGLWQRVGAAERGSSTAAAENLLTPPEERSCCSSSTRTTDGGLKDTRDGTLGQAAGTGGRCRWRRQGKDVAGGGVSAGGTQTGDTGDDIRCLWWFCLVGAALGWRDKVLESQYLQSSRQDGGKPFGLFVLGAVELVMHTPTLVRMIGYVYTGMCGREVLPGVFWAVLSMNLLTCAYGSWLMLSPSRQQRQQLGWVSTIVETLRVLCLCGQYDIGQGLSGCLEAMQFLVEPTWGYFAMLAHICIIQPALLQLPPPWLWRHTITVMLMAMFGTYAMPGMCGWNWPGLPLGLQAVAAVMVGVGLAVVAGANSRARYLNGICRNA